MNPELKKNNPIDTDIDPSPKPGATRLRLYWTRGKGAAKIRWGVAGDFNRCVNHLRKYVSDPKGLCNVYHVAAVGAPPGHGHPGGKDDDVEGMEFKDDFDVELQETLLYAKMLKESSVAELIDIFADEEETKDNNMELEHKNLSTSGSITEVSDDGVIEALVSVTGIKDNVNDIIVPGAYEKTLASRKPKGVNHHDWTQPIARPEEIKELLPGDPKLPSKLANGEPWPKEAGALYVKMRFNLETQSGREAYSNVKFYAEDAEFSIGYNVPKGAAHVDSKTGIRHIKSLDLYEFSPVLWGAASNARTLISSVKGLFESDEKFMAEVKSVIEHKDDEVGVEVAENEPEEVATDVEVTTAAEVSADPSKGEPVGQTPVPAVADPVTEVSTEAGDKFVGDSAVLATPSQVAEVTEAIGEAKAFIPQDDATTVETRVQKITSAIEAVEAITETIQTDPPTGVVVEKLKTLQVEVEKVLNGAGVNKPPAVPTVDPVPAPVKAEAVETETKSMREAMNTIISGPFDAGIADELDNGVRALEASIKALDYNAIQSNANALLDDVSYAMQSGASNAEIISDLKALVSAISEALKNTAKPNGSTTPLAQPQQEAPPASAQKTMTAEEFKDLQKFLNDI